MTESLLERLKNNFMIVEVWDKKTSADNDKVGTSHSDSRITIFNIIKLQAFACTHWVNYGLFTLYLVLISSQSINPFKTIG